MNTNCFELPPTDSVVIASLLLPFVGQRVAAKEDEPLALCIGVAAHNLLARCGGDRARLVSIFENFAARAAAREGSLTDLGKNARGVTPKSLMDRVRAGRISASTNQVTRQKWADMISDGYRENRGGAAAMWAAAELALDAQMPEHWHEGGFAGTAAGVALKLVASLGHTNALTLLGQIEGAMTGKLPSDAVARAACA